MVMLIITGEMIDRYERDVAGLKTGRIGNGHTEYTNYEELFASSKHVVILVYLEVYFSELYYKMKKKVYFIVTAFAFFT